MNMKLTGETWLVVERNNRGFADLRVDRVSIKKPSVGPNQVAVKLELELPSGLFTEPVITARVVLEDEVAPEKISIETVAGVDAALTAAGFTVRVVAGDQA